MKPTTLIALAGRRSANSTELFIQAEDDLDEVFVELWGKAELAGYARLTRARSADEVRGGRLVATFELAELLSARSPCPGPLVSLSAVLWSRQELLEGPSGCRFSLLPEDQTPGPSLQSAGGGCPHEV